MIYSCCDDNRRAAVMNNPSLNAIDFLELADEAGISGLPSQQILFVHCLKVVPETLTTDNVLIRGGESITGITAQWVASGADQKTLTANLPGLATYLNGKADSGNILVVCTSVAGDFSPYTLSLVASVAQATTSGFAVANALAGFDPQLSSVTFSFKVDCGPYFDCDPPPAPCPADVPTPPPINYLAKDYGSFKTILLDRMNQLLPSWGVTSEADLGIVLAELVAYIGDQLSYQQDAVATEAYLMTARSRISLRRHAKLVDYQVHDGCNARAFVCVQVQVPVFLSQAATNFYTYAPGMPSTLLGNEQAALAAGVVVFESMQDANLYPEHNTMQFYTWGDLNCCLPQGATEATLAGYYPNLQAGDVLIFEEVLGPQTGVAADADIRHRYAVRLTSVATVNNQGALLADPLFDKTGAPIVGPTQQPQPVTEIAWSDDDALPAPLCLSSTFTNASGETQTLTNVSIVLGNIVLADQGLSMPAATLPAVPESTLFVPAASTHNRCAASTPTPLPVRYRPQLVDRPVTQAVPLPTAAGPATSTPVPLLQSGYISLPDSNGFTSLMVGANDVASWPQYFGVAASAGTTAGTLTLSVVFNPPGLVTPIALETYANLTDPTDAAQQINKLSKLISAKVPIGATTPSNFAQPVTQLEITGTVSLENASHAPYLLVQPTPTASWPPLFAVLAQGNLQTPGEFNLLLVYNPSFGAVGGVSLPAILVTYPSVTLATATTTFSAGDALLEVLTFDQQPNPALSAYDLMNLNAADAVPSITLTDEDGNRWTAAQDLLADGASDKNFVVEVESTGVATLRFGDNTNGLSPAANTVFTAKYRIGNGTAGNVGAESLIYFTGDPRIVSCMNPLPASGGVDPETNAQIQRRAPQAFLTQERAITMADYMTAAEANTQVESAAATLRWTGSWYTVFVTAEPQGGAALGKSLRKSLTQSLNAYRLAGQDLKLNSPDYVSLQIALTVCVDAAYFQSNVQAALMQVLGPGTQPNGPPGVFAPGNFQLGQSVYLSPIYAAARTVAGVTSVVATAFQPQAVPFTTSYIAAGEINLAPTQVARLANDSSLPANGQLTFNLQGGK
jgi:hypothetical protein